MNKISEFQSKRKESVLLRNVVEMNRLIKVKDNKLSINYQLKNQNFLMFLIDCFCANIKPNSNLISLFEPFYSAFVKQNKNVKVQTIFLLQLLSNKAKMWKFKPWHWTAETAGFGILHSLRRTRAPRELLMQPVVNQKSNSFDFFVFVFRLMLSVANKKLIHLIVLKS